MAAYALLFVPGDSRSNLNQCDGIGFLVLQHYNIWVFLTMMKSKIARVELNKQTSKSALRATLN